MLVQIMSALVLAGLSTAQLACFNFGDCPRDTFCSVETNTCVPRYAAGALCRFDWECRVGLECDDSRCQDDWTQFAPQINERRNTDTTVGIVFIALGCVLAAVGVGVLIYCFQRRQLGHRVRHSPSFQRFFGKQGEQMPLQSQQTRSMPTYRVETEHAPMNREPMSAPAVPVTVHETHIASAV